MRILFCFLSSPGHLHPAVGLALRARERGHEVAFATGVKAGAFLADRSLWRIERGPDGDGPSFDVELWARPLSVAIQIKHIEHALTRFQPDVLITGQLTLGPLLLRERLGVPVAVLGGITYLWPFEPGQEDRTQRDARLAWRYREMIEHYGAAAALFGLTAPDPRIHPRHSPLLGDQFLLRTVPELEPSVLRLPWRVRLVGGCLWQTGPDSADAMEAAEWAERMSRDGRQIIYVEQSRTFDKPAFWPVLCEALADPDIAVAASLGRADVPLGAYPEHWLVRGHVPQEAVLNRATAVVGSPTTTLALGALSFGLPALYLPSGGEQLDVAEVVVGSGAASRLSLTQIGASALKQAFTCALSDRWMRRSAARLAAEFCRLDDRTLALQLVEDLTAERSGRRAPATATV